MKRVVTESDLDIIKEHRKVEKEIDKALIRNCLICRQPMKYVDSLTWVCKNCDVITIVSNIISFKKG